MHKFLFIFLILLFPFHCSIAGIIKFAQISDLHLTQNMDDHYQRAERIIAYLNEIEDLSFVILSGDLLKNTKDDEINDQALDHALELLSKLKKPIVITRGNHDLASQYEMKLGQDSPYRPQLQNGVIKLDHVQQQELPFTLIGIDSMNPEDKAGGGIISIAAIEIMEKFCSTLKPIILAIHHPPLQENCIWAVSKLKPSIAPAFHIEGIDLLNVFLKATEANIKAILSGHLHSGWITSTDSGIPLILAPSTAPQKNFALTHRFIFGTMGLYIQEEPGFCSICGTRKTKISQQNLFLLMKLIKKPNKNQIVV